MFFFSYGFQAKSGAISQTKAASKPGAAAAAKKDGKYLAPGVDRTIT